VLSPFLGGACRFYPSCSEYAIAAVTRDGVWRGGRRAFARLGRCQPLGPGGLDLP
jgi:putative membrane protein insertion efficiency factor